MPMPPGLLPVGNAVSAAKRPAGLPKPPTSGVLQPSHQMYDSTVLTSGGQKPSAGLAALRNQYMPLPWTDFFDTMEMINDRVPVYTAGTEGHVFVCMHGAGHSALSFARFAEIMKD